MTYSYKRYVSGAALFALFIFSFCAIAALVWDDVFFFALPFALVFVLFTFIQIEFPYYVLLFTLTLSSYQDITSTLNFDMPVEILQILVTGLFLFYLLKKHSFYTARIFKQPFVLVILVSLFWTAVAVMYSEAPLFSFKFLVKKIWFLVPFVFFPIGFFNKKEKLVQAYHLIIWPLLFTCVLFLYKYAQTGFAFDEVHGAVQPFYINHVIFGAYTSSLLPVVICSYFLLKGNKLKKLLIIFFVILLFTAIYYSYSRAAWAAIVFGLVMMVGVRLKLAHIGILVFYVVIIFFVAFMIHQNRFLRYTTNYEETVMHDDIGDHLMATFKGRDISSAERYYRWIAAIRMSRDYPITGVGPNMFSEKYRSYGLMEFQTWVSRNLEKSTTHNYFLFMLVEQGYPAMILYAFFIFLIFYKGQKIYDNYRDPFYRNIILSVLGMLGAVFINNFFSELLETTKIGGLFYLGIAVLVVLDVFQPKFEGGYE